MIKWYASTLTEWFFIITWLIWNSFLIRIFSHRTRKFFLGAFC